MASRRRTSLCLRKSHSSLPSEASFSRGGSPRRTSRSSSTKTAIRRKENGGSGSSEPPLSRRVVEYAFVLSCCRIRCVLLYILVNVHSQSSIHRLVLCMLCSHSAPRQSASFCADERLFHRFASLAPTSYDVACARSVSKIRLFARSTSKT
jgi:hypothetical protein